jgi:hypothetical protein
MNGKDAMFRILIYDDRENIRRNDSSSSDKKKPRKNKTRGSNKQ